MNLLIFYKRWRKITGFVSDLFIGKSKLTNEEALRDFERIHAIEMEKAGKGPVPVTYKYNPKLKRKQKDRESLKL